MNLTVDPEFKSIIPPLTKDEYETLRLSIENEGIRDSLITTPEGVIVDGHNRYEIAESVGLQEDEIPITVKEFVDRDSIKLWMIDNQNGRRNITDGWKYELARVKKKILLEQGKKNKGANQYTPERVLSVIDKTQHNTQKEIAADLGWSTGKTAQADYVWTHGGDDIKDDVKSGETTINAAYAKTKQTEKRKEALERLDLIAEKHVEEPTGEYDVIVIDPPWPMKKIDRDVRPNQVEFDYPTMTEDELQELSIPAAADAHLWLWATHKYLPTALRLLDHWGFKYICAFVWHKPGGPQPFNLPQYNCEFALYAHRGNPVFTETKAFPACFNASRKEHSAKPGEFYDMVRRVTSGRRIDMFNRRAIDGFDAWGNES